MFVLTIFLTGYNEARILKVSHYFQNVIGCHLIPVAVTSAEENCEEMLCSNIIDHVCGVARNWDGAMVISKYQNICHLKKIQCRLQSIVGSFL